MISELILYVENKWQNLLENEVNRIFTDCWLPSHDLCHHRRVWGFSKLLIKEFSIQEVDFIEASIIAAYMHDTGLSNNLKPEHGEISSKFTEEFLQKCPMNTILFRTELLEAIKIHDDKSYGSFKFEDNPPGLYEILTIADDLDALGALGLYRYFEIYFMRNNPVSSIKRNIEKNLGQRFDFLAQILNKRPRFIDKQKLRYEKAIHYLSVLDNQDMELIKKLVENHTDPNDFPIERLINYENLINFFREINLEEKELSFSNK